MYLDGLAETLHEFIYRIVYHFFEQHIDAVIVGGSVAQFADVHAWPGSNMLVPFQCSDIVVVIFCHIRL